MASLWFKKMVQMIIGRFFVAYRLFYSIMAAILLILIVAFQYSHSSIALFRAPAFAKIIMIITGSYGLFIMAASVKQYFFQLSGISVITKTKQESKPQVTGPNAYVRHPLYGGTLLLLWSLFMLFPLFSNLIACTVITIYTFIGIQLEEKKLEIEFGEDYTSYRDKTPMIIPSLKRAKTNSA
jgi:protein-S-isoprenylcysteine O-methyltransferase Ste14